MAHGLCGLQIAELRLRQTLRTCNIFAFPLQQWLHERTSLLVLYVQCLFCFFVRYMVTVLLDYFFANCELNERIIGI